MGQHGEGTEGQSRLPLLENPTRTLATTRAAIALLLTFFVIGYEPPAGVEPHVLVRPMAAVLVAGFFALSALQVWNSDWATRRIDVVVIDAVLVLSLIGLYSFDPRRVFFPLLYGVVAEAAILLGLRAAVVTWAATTVLYGVRESLSATLLEVDVSPAAFFLRVAIGLGLAALIGSLVNQVRAVRAFQHEREEVDRLRQIDEMKNAFLAAVSHDLKNPLTAILGFATTIRSRLDRLPPERTREMVDHIVNSARRLQGMLDDLLDVDRMERGVLEPKLQSTDMGDLVRQVIEHVDHRDHLVRTELEEITAEVDGAKVERIIENLVVNAIKYTPAGSTVTVRMGRKRDGVLISVEDEGAGVPDDLKEILFEPFQRAPDAGERATGSGIGLSLVSRFAQLHDGRAWIEDRPGGGAAFKVFLPAPTVPTPGR